MKENNLELFMKLSKMQWLLQRNHIRSHTAHGPMADPTRGQGRVLALLKIQPKITTKELSYLLGIRQQSLNELLNKLERGGYVSRIPSEEDRRVMMVTLTEKGEGEQQPEADLSNIFDCLSEEEQKTFGEYLERIIAAMEEQLGGEDWDKIESWMKAARSRMGDEKFEQLKLLLGGLHMYKHGADVHGKFGGGFGHSFGDCAPIPPKTPHNVKKDK